MISLAQRNQRLAQATRLIETAYPTTFSIGSHVDLPASRWSSGTAAAAELAGLLPTCELALRVRRTVLAGIPVVEERTTLIEGGKTYRVKRVRSALGDPCVVLECATA